MKVGIWTSGLVAGIIATIPLAIITTTLSYFNLISLSETEYAARFILYLPHKETLSTLEFIVGLITNFGIGSFFGIIIAFFYKEIGFEEKYIKIIIIGGCLWFFHLAIVPFLDPTVESLSTARTAIEFFVIYMLWSLIATLIIEKLISEHRSL
jgi:hypothetical protein